MERMRRRIRKKMVEITTSFKQFLAGAFDVHEEEGDQESLGGGDDEGDGGVEAAEIDVGGLVGEESADKQGGPDGEVGLQGRRFCVIRHKNLRFASSR